MNKDKTVTKQELRQLESEAILKSEKGDKPYRKKYRKTFKLVTCSDCGTFQDLRLIRTKRESSFRTAIYMDKFGIQRGHKKLRNNIAIKDDNGNKIYLCSECFEKRRKMKKDVSK